EAEIDPGDVEADDLDLARVADAETALVAEADELERHRVEAHQLRCDGIDRDHVAGGEDEVFNVRSHGARAWAVPRDRAVRDGEDAGVNLLLNSQQVDECLMDLRVSPVAAEVEQAAERVLHRTGHRRKDV